MSIQEREAQLFDYLQGTLSPQERQEFEVHLESCGECREALARSKQGEEILQSMLVRPSPDFTDQILARIKERPMLPPEPVAVPTSAAPPLGFSSLAASWLGGLALVGVFVLAMAINSMKPPDPRQSPVAPGPVMTVGQASPAMAVAQASSPVPLPVPTTIPYVVVAATETPIVVRQKPPVPGLPSEVIGRLVLASGTWSGQSLTKPSPFSSGTFFSTGDNGRIELALNACGRIWLGPSSGCFVETGAITLSSGSAWFSVASRHGNSPVRVLCNGHLIEVIGTRFGLSNRPDGTAVVALFEGELCIIGSNGMTAGLLAGKKARINGQGIHRSGLSPEDQTFWRKISGDSRLALPIPIEQVSPLPATAREGVPATGAAGPSEADDFIRYLLEKQRNEKNEAPSDLPGMK